MEGKLVLSRNNDIGYTIGTDGGEYEGCKPELNVRKLKNTRKLNLRWDNPLLTQIMDTTKDAAYGMGYSTGRLHPVTEDQVAALVQEESRIDQEKETLRAKEQSEYEAGRVQPEITGAKREKLAAEYDRIHNEGGEGYNPYRD